MNRILVPLAALLVVIVMLMLSSAVYGVATTSGTLTATVSPTMAGNVYVPLVLNPVQGGWLPPTIP
jgi:hypothetical protein